MEMSYCTCLGRVAKRMLQVARPFTTNNACDANQVLNTSWVLFLACLYKWQMPIGCVGRILGNCDVGLILWEGTA